MSQNISNQTDRINRFKEARKKQLALQFSNLSSPKSVNVERSTVEDHKSTRTSSLRSELNHANSSIIKSKTVSEKSVDLIGLTDKSSKRKSFLNRSTNSEIVSYGTSGDINRRNRVTSLPEKIIGSRVEDSTLKSTSTNIQNPKPATNIRIKNYKNKTITTNRNKNDSTKINQRMEELSAITKKTLEKVELLTHRARESRKKEHSLVDSQIDVDVLHIKNNSILKNKLDKPTVENNSLNTPISILKRKVLGDFKVNGSSSSLPVTFSAPLVQPSTSRSRQGILKKRRSLDDSKIMRHRSCSPELLHKSHIRSSILKCQRRSSLEELNKTNSPETQLHGILRSQSVKSVDSLNSPHGILKRKSGINSANSCQNSTSHVSITTAVILAAARGAEMILNKGNENVKPILKKASFSDEHSSLDGNVETPKPILKKRFSTDTDEIDDTLKPILKLSKGSKDSETSDIYTEETEEKIVNNQTENESELVMVNSQNSTLNCKGKSKKDIFKSYNIRTDIKHSKQTEDRNLKKSRPFSVHELVTNFEKSTEICTGAIPKKTLSNRNQDRFKTQPVTFNEFKQSLDLLNLSLELPNKYSSSSLGDLMDFVTNQNINSARQYSEGGIKQSPTKEENIFSGQNLVSPNNTRKDEQIINDINLKRKFEDLPIKNVTLRKPNCHLVGLETTNSTDTESSGSKEIQTILKTDHEMLKKKLQKGRIKSKIDFNDKDKEAHSTSSMNKSIADLRIKLQENGEAWKNRIPQNTELTLLKVDENQKSMLNIKKHELDASSKLWMSRVHKTDSVDFITLKQSELTLSNNAINIKKTLVTPKANRFKGKKELDCCVKNENSKYTKSIKTDAFMSRVVPVIQPNDITYQLFFKSVDQVPTNTEKIQISVDDFDAISRDNLLVLKKSVPYHKRKIHSKNPLKALLKRNDISTEYTEIITGVVEREQKRLMIEKISKTLMPDKNLDALAGLASKEDFTSIELKKPANLTKMLPYKSLMLIHIKGRRYIQVRLVKPCFQSINEGDCYLLITEHKLYKYIGINSNIIEQSKTANIAKYIKKTGDLGCKKIEIIEVCKELGSTNIHLKAFWSFLNVYEVPETVEAGHPGEDETYESNILHTNMIYEFDNGELVPIKDIWGSIPKFEVLLNTKIIIFDFGSEMYVWCGKNAESKNKKTAVDLAKEMWENGYDYSDCNFSPLDIASILGASTKKNCSLKNQTRPDWALFTKLTQHRETILFKEKFLDWKEDSQVININIINNIEQESKLKFLSGDNVIKMLEKTEEEPELIIQDIHIGRGNQYFDKETRRLFEFDTLQIQAWTVLENNSIQLNNDSIGQFFDCDTYIYCWKFRMTVKGRELNGKPSKHLQIGKDKSVFFCWHGNQSSVKEKCAAALLTLELDKNSTPQIQVHQGTEPAAFLSLFNGTMIILNGKRFEQEVSSEPKMFIVRGELESEIHLLQVKIGIEHLRSRTSFVIVNLKNNQVIVWHGCAASSCTKVGALKSVKKIINKKPSELKLPDDVNLIEINEGKEDESFYNIFGKSQPYFSLIDSTITFNFTPRLFQFNSVTGNVQVNEILCPYRSTEITPFPFLQTELYNSNQPALYLIDNQYELWLWQGWCPVEDEVESGHEGISKLRWQNERKIVIQAAIHYWSEKNNNTSNAYLVYAGLEPIAFKNIFPSWTEMSIASNYNLKDGKTDGQKTVLLKELLYLTKESYSLNELLNRPLPDGVDPCHLEMYLSKKEFEDLLHMSKEEFQKLPNWKQTKIKKDKGLF